MATKLNDHQETIHKFKPNVKLKTSTGLVLVLVVIEFLCYKFDTKVCRDKRLEVILIASNIPITFCFNHFLKLVTNIGYFK